MATVTHTRADSSLLQVRQHGQRARVDRWKRTTRESRMTKVYFGTNRNPNRKNKPSDFGRDFSSDGLANLRFGKADVTGQDLDTYDIYVAPEILREDRDLGIADGKSSVFGSINVFRRVRARMIQRSSDTIIFIHGYNVSFHEALTSAARLKRNFSQEEGGPGVNVVLFSWPSDGSKMPFVAYGNDRKDAAASGPAFARGLLNCLIFFVDRRLKTRASSEYI